MTSDPLWSSFSLTLLVRKALAAGWPERPALLAAMGFTDISEGSDDGAEGCERGTCRYKDHEVRWHCVDGRLAFVSTEVSGAGDADALERWAAALQEHFKVTPTKDWGELRQPLIRGWLVRERLVGVVGAVDGPVAVHLADPTVAELWRTRRQRMVPYPTPDDVDGFLARVDELGLGQPVDQRDGLWRSLGLREVEFDDSGRNPWGLLAGAGFQNLGWSSYGARVAEISATVMSRMESDDPVLTAVRDRLEQVIKARFGPPALVDGTTTVWRTPTRSLSLTRHDTPSPQRRIFQYLAPARYTVSLSIGDRELADLLLSLRG